MVTFVSAFSASQRLISTFAVLNPLNGHAVPSAMRNASNLNAEQFAGFFVACSAEAALVVAVIAVSIGRHTGQAHDLPPAEGWADRVVFLADGVHGNG